HLPASPQAVIARSGASTTAKAPLYVRTTDAHVRIIEKHLDGPTPYIKASIDLGAFAHGDTASAHIEAGWVYPDVSGHNWGLKTYRLRLDQLDVKDDGDPFPKGDGDWRFWVMAQR